MMTDCAVLMHSLRMCASENCSECHVADLENCSLALMRDAADAIERLQNELEYTSRQYELALEDLEKAEQPTSVMEYPQVEGITSTLITPEKEERGCPPDYNPGFCYGDEDCDACWEGWRKEQEETE